MAASRSFDDLAHPTIIEPGAKKYSCRSWRVLGPTRDGVHSLYPASRKRNETPPYIYITLVVYVYAALNHLIQGPFPWWMIPKTSH